MVGTYGGIIKPGCNLIHFVLSFVLGPTVRNRQVLSSSTSASCLNPQLAPGFAVHQGVYHLRHVGDHADPVQEQKPLTGMRRRHVDGRRRFLGGPSCFLRGRSIEVFILQHHAINLEDASLVQLLDEGDEYRRGETYFDNNGT